MIFPLLFNFSTHIKVFISGTGVPLQLNLEGSRLAFVPSSLPPSWGDKPPSLSSLPVVSVFVSPRELTHVYVSYHSVLEKQGTNSFTLLEQHFFAIILCFFNFLLFSMYTERLWLLKLRKPDSMAGVCVYKK